jgi:hypothetical protein
MHEVRRRVALAMALPLAVAAPVVLIAGPAHAADTILLTTSEEAGVYGQVVTATAKVTDGDESVTDGCVEFEVALTAHESVMTVMVPLDDTGTATTPALVDQETGLPLEPNGDEESWNVHAAYYSDYTEDCTMSYSLFADTSFDVLKAGSSIVVTPTATTLSADIVGVFPGGVLETSLKPDGGAVQFKVDGVVVGSTTAAAGTASISYALGSGSHTIEASYAGDDRYLPSSTTAGTARKDPLLEARLISTFPKTKSGWYRNAVQVWFVCRPQGSELVEDCPADVSLKKSGKNQSVTRTITALDGGTATLTIHGIDIDRQKPVITVTGRTCTATDKLSGVKGRCKMRIAPNGTYRAVAVDKAGNRAVKRGRLD